MKEYNNDPLTQLKSRRNESLEKVRTRYDIIEIDRPNVSEAISELENLKEEEKLYQVHIIAFVYSRKPLPK